MSYKCEKRHAPFANHTIHWWCFLLPKHYPYTRKVKENGTIIDTPLSFRNFIRDIEVTDEV